MTDKKMIAAGHICLDITPVFPPERKSGSVAELLVPGRLLNVGAADIHTGGSVANTGLALKKLGVDVKLLGKVGDDELGSIVRRIAGEHGAGGLLVDKESTTSYSVVLALPGLDRIFLHDPGANDSFLSADIPDEALSDCDLFHFGYPPIMRGMYRNGGAELISLMKRVRSLGIATSLDLAAVDPASEAGRADWRGILGGTLPYVDLFVPSFEELCFMLDRERYERLAASGGDMTEKLSIEADVIPLAQVCIAMGAGAVMIKCGMAGVYLCCSDSFCAGERLELDCEKWRGVRGHIPCYKAERVLSATGAGDTSIAAFLTAAAMGREPLRCAAIAAAEGAWAVTSYDALGGLKTIDDLEAWIDAR